MKRKLTNKKEIAKAKRVGRGFTKIADTLEITKNLNGDLKMNMYEAELKFDGKPMSFSGIYTLAIKPRDEVDGAHEFYYEGLVAKECGFKSTDDPITFEIYYSGRKLSIWARDNPELWGNKDGEYMFSSNNAFGIAESRKLLLSDIIAHLREVAERCAELETT